MKNFKQMHSERRGTTVEKEQNHTTRNKSDKAQNESSAAQERRTLNGRKLGAHEELGVGYK